MSILQMLCNEFNIKVAQGENVIKLIDDGNTIPFIARYRKEMTGSLDDQILREIGDRLEYLRNMQKRREEVFALIAEQEKMTPEIEKSLESAVTLAEIDDIYRPFRPKRKTRASVANEKGLEPLAVVIFASISPDPIEKIAAPFINEQVPSIEEAVAGACDIIAEWIADNVDIRKKLREFFQCNAVIKSVGTKDEDSVYRNYYDYEENIAMSAASRWKIAPHRILAIDRGEREGFLRVSLVVDEVKALDIIYNTVVKNNSELGQLVKTTADDSYKRLIFPSLEREIRNDLTDAAHENAIKVFGTNLSQLLMQPPVKGSIVLGLDPAYRTGCKFAIVDDIGRVLEVGVVYPTPPNNKKAEAIDILSKAIKKHKVNTMSIGNGTASHETEVFATELIAEMGGDIAYMVVSEAGASVYSASKLAKEEFPEYDVSLRSAVSIARRLQDPLAELVKIDPKAIGVGQYQHDLPPKRLSQQLDGVVESCVNNVGVDLNTASVSLLTQVAGISAGVAKEIVKFREENGAFNKRIQLKNVPKLGPKAFEQCAGFLRISGGENPLDNTSVHPESYKAAENFLKICGYKLNDIEKSNLQQKVLSENCLLETADSLGIGVPTLHDIIDALLKPGRDPRDELPPPLLRKGVMSIDDLSKGMVLTGTIRNVIDFGAFVDIGVHQDGLVHISQMANKFIKHPSEVVKVGDIVKVSVLEIDKDKGRISLTMRI
jgi:uncharacterized protein